MDTYDFDDDLDIEEEFTEISKRTISYRRQMKRKNDIRRKDIINRCGYAPHLGYIDYGYVDEKWLPVGNHIKYPQNSNCQRWIKRLTSKKVRKANVPNGNGYRRIFDYWWTLY